MINSLKKIAQSFVTSVCAATLLASIVNLLPWQSVFANHHNGSQRYGDVIITRNADGTIESRDASGPTYSGPVYTSGPSQHSAKHGSHASSKTNHASKTSTTGNKRTVASAKRGPASHHASSSHSDDVIITRNADGSVEARDAQ